MNRQSRVYNRAEAMVQMDKFNFGKSEFFDELQKMVCRYYDCDGITVQTTRGKDNHLVITLSVKGANKTNFAR